MSGCRIRLDVLPKEQRDRGHGKLGRVTERLGFVAMRPKTVPQELPESQQGRAMASLCRRGHIGILPYSLFAKVAK